MCSSQDKYKGEGELAVFRVFSTKRWDRRSRADLIESATPCHDAKLVGSYRVSNPLHLTILASKAQDYTTAPQHLLQRFSKDKYGVDITADKVKITLL